METLGIIAGFYTIIVCGTTHEICEQLLKIAVGCDEFEKEKQENRLIKQFRYLFYGFMHNSSEAFTVAHGFPRSEQYDEDIRFIAVTHINLRQLKLAYIDGKRPRPFKIYAPRKRNKNGCHEGLSISVCAYTKEHALELANDAKIKSPRHNLVVEEEVRDFAWTRLQDKCGYFTIGEKEVPVLTDNKRLITVGHYSVG